MTSQGVAIVTGAAQGLGRAIALRLARDGYSVLINDIPSQQSKLEELEKEITAIGRPSSIFTGSVAEEEVVKGMVDAAVEKLGGLDVMVANAGVCPTGSIVEMDMDVWDRTFAINTRGTLLCYKYAAIQMIKQGRGGRIIGASSAAGKQGSAMISAYSSTKFSIRGLTQSAAQELAPHGITVNAYAPGAIETSMMRDSMNEVTAGHFDEFVAARNDFKIGEPDDIAAIVSFMVRKEAKFMTGQSVSVNGGMYFD